MRTPVLTLSRIPRNRQAPLIVQVLNPQGPHMLSAWLTDLRHAARSLRRAPAFFATTVVTLALAIGAVAGMFNVVYAVLLRPLPFPEPDRLVVVLGTAPGSDLPARFGP